MPADPRPVAADDPSEPTIPPPEVTPEEHRPTDPERGTGPPPPLEGFERWARIVFYVLGVLGVMLGILAISGGPAGPTGLLGAAAVFVGAALLFGVAWGLHARRSWGRPTAVLLLWVILMLGVIRLAYLLFVAGDMTVPIEAILAFVVLTTLPQGTRREIGEGSDRAVAELYAAGYAMTALLPLVIR